jgi:hypothetical protein
MGSAQSADPEPPPPRPLAGPSSAVVTVHRYTELLQTMDEPELTKAFDDARATLMEELPNARLNAPEVKQLNSAIFQMQRKYKKKLNELWHEYVTRTESVDLLTIRDSFAFFVAAARVKRVEIVIETGFDDAKLIRSLVQVLMVGTGSLEQITIRGPALIETFIDQCINEARRKAEDMRMTFYSDALDSVMYAKPFGYHTIRWKESDKRRSEMDPSIVIWTLTRKKKQ